MGGGKGACANQCCEFKPPLKNPPPTPPGSRPSTETAPTPRRLSTDRLCSVERILTPRASASSLRTEVTSLERDSSVTAAGRAVSSTARPPRESKDKQYQD